LTAIYCDLLWDIAIILKYCPALATTYSVSRAIEVTAWLASFPGPRRGGEKGLVSTVCACA